MEKYLKFKTGNHKIDAIKNFPEFQKKYPFKERGIFSLRPNIIKDKISLIYSIRSELKSHSDKETFDTNQFLEETARFLKQKSINEVGIIATSTTLNGKLYEKCLSDVGIKQVTPDDFQQAKIGKIINNLVLNRHNNGDREEIQSIIDGFSRSGVKTVILACTDLQLLIPKHDEVAIYDTMKIFAEATVKYLLN